MSQRLGSALVEHIRRMPGATKFVLIEGVSERVAQSMSDRWDGAELPALAVASESPERFGGHALAGASGTGLRNIHPEGVCLVICEGAGLPDRQSLNKFENVAPGDLLGSVEGLALLAQAEPAVAMDGVPRDVRQAIAQLSRADRPSAGAVAEYFDRVTAGEPPLRALPILGGFRDDAHGSPSSTRIRENLALAARRRSDELVSPGSFGDIRRRAERVIRRRPGVDGEAAASGADGIMALLQAGGDELLSALSFDEAREVLARQQQDLTGIVRQELADYRLAREDHQPDAPDVPWSRYEREAEALRRPDDRRAAAGELLGFDDVEGRQVFQRATRKKLERMLKDRVIRATDPSCPELGLLRAARALEGGLKRVQLVRPEPLADGAQPSRANAARALSLACARLRLGKLFADLEETFGTEIDGSLSQAAELQWPEVFEDAELDRGRNLETVQLRLYGDGRDSLLLEWRPDLDDLATLRAALLFAEERALYAHTPGTPALASFCAGAAPSIAPVSAPLADIAGSLQAAARALVDHGLSPEILDGWAGRWRRAVAAEESAGRAERAGDLGLAGTIVGPEAVALTALAPLKSEWLSQHLDALWSLVFLAMHDRDDEEAEPLEDTAVGVARTTAAHFPLTCAWPHRTGRCSPR